MKELRKLIYPFAYLHSHGCCNGMAKILKRTMFQRSGANVNSFLYRLHNETLGQKINSTHDCLDYYM